MTEAVPQEFWQGVEQFNQGQFYACHDTLEALWMEATEPQKTLYQGILQIAVALYHLGNSNWRGAVILLGEGINRLRRYPPTYAGIDVDELLTSSAAMLTALQQAGPEKIGDWIIGNGGIALPNEDQSLRLPKLIPAVEDTQLRNYSN
jgi:predicted metal-dependent hydrolase